MSKQPLIIKRGSFVCTLYDINSLLEMPLANLRKLWKIMLDAADENEEPIEAIREWLPTAIADTDTRLCEERTDCKLMAQEVETRRRTVAAFGSMVTKEQKADLASAQRILKTAERRATAAKAANAKAHKLQTIFNEMAERARI